MAESTGIGLAVGGTRGLCALIGQVCCTFIPANTAPAGKFTQAMTDLKALRNEVKGNAGKGTEWFEFLKLDLGGWGASLLKIGLAVVLTLIIVSFIICCCIPIFRSRVKTHYAFPVGAIKPQRETESNTPYLLTDRNTLPDLYPVPGWAKEGVIVEG